MDRRNALDAAHAHADNARVYIARAEREVSGYDEHASTLAAEAFAAIVALQGYLDSERGL